jgi:hypothetical protein
MDRRAAAASSLAAQVGAAGCQANKVPKQKGHAMSRKTTTNAVALAAGILGIAGAVAIIAASPLRAAPFALNAAAARTMASNQPTDVAYYRHRYYHGGYYRHGYYGRGYYRHGYYPRGWGYPYRYGYPYGAYGYPYGY